MSSNTWPDQAMKMLKQLNIEHPIIQAPMAGGPSTPELVAAVCNAGGLGSLGCGYLKPDQIDSEIHKVKEITKNPYAVNLFVPGSSTNEEPSNKVLRRLKAYSDELGIKPPEVPDIPEYSFEDQVEVVIRNEVPVFSFTFGIPDKAIIKDMLEHSIFIVGTATCVEEGLLLEEAGCHAIVAQGSEAGGHRGTFGSTIDTPMIGTMALVPQLVDKMNIPVISSGGIMDGRAIAASLALGASAVQAGTAFLSCKEARVPKPWLDSISSSMDISTVITKAFSGKYARGIKNRFIEEMADIQDEIPNYPIQNSLTRQIRNAAKESGNSDFMSLWAGQGVSMSRECTAKELIEKLVVEANTVLRNISSNL